jgi:hypothetical protein
MFYAYLAVFALEGREDTHYQERQEALSCLYRGVGGFVAGMVPTYAVYLSPVPPPSHVGVLFL